MRGRIRKKIHKIYIFLVLMMVMGLAAGASGSSKIQAADKKEMLEHPFIFQVSTGSSGGEEISILRITYKSDGKEYRQYVFPQEGELEKSFKEAQKYVQNDKFSMENRMEIAMKLTGYKMDGWEKVLAKEETDDSKKKNTKVLSGLLSNTADSYIVNFKREVDEIVKVEAIASRKKGEEKGYVDWMCMGMRFYEVSRTGDNWDIYGIGMKGYLSEDFFIRFNGTLRAELNMLGQESCMVQDFITTFDTREATGNPYLVNYAKDTTGERTFSTEQDSIYYLKVDMADRLLAGIESYANPEGQKVRKLSEMRLPESMVCKVSYNDKDGSANVINVPLITSCMTAIAEQGVRYRNEIVESNSTFDSKGNPLSGMAARRILEIAEQGGSIVVPLYLPRCETIKYVNIDYGIKNIDTKVGLKPADDKTNVRTAIEQDMEKNEDNIGIVAISVLEQKVTGSDKTFNTSAAYYEAYMQNVVKVLTEKEEKAGNKQYGVREDRYSLTVPEQPRDNIRVIGYYVAESPEGKKIELGKKEKFVMKTVEGDANPNLKPLTDSTGRILAVIKTGNLDISSSQSEIFMKLQYETYDGTVIETEPLSMWDMAKEFYGCIPDQDGNDVSGLIGQQTGNTFFGLFQLEEEASKIVGASFHLAGGESGSDDWNIISFQLYRAESVSTRTGYWIDETRVGEHRIDRIYTRLVNGLCVIDDNLDVVVPGSTVLNTTTGKEWMIMNVSPTLLISGSDEVSIKFDGVIETQSNDFEWREDYGKRMDYSITKRKLGFNTPKLRYKVNVTVGQDVDDGSGNGDCGSKNLFYFQLLFENNKSSAIVQANQQLSSDGFRSGMQEEFMIDVNQSFGDVKAIRVIPDTTQDSSDIYDKLKIEKISVSCARNSGISYSYVFDVNDWVGIDIEDEQTKDRGKQIDEVARTYIPSGQTDNVTLEFVLTMGAANPKNPLQFQGKVKGDIVYIDTAGKRQKKSIDVVTRMYEYRKRAAIETSVRNEMFKPNRSERFHVELENVQQIRSLELIVTSVDGETMFFNVASVGINRVSETGTLGINYLGEYEQNSSLRKKVCSSLEEGGVSTDAHADVASRVQVTFPTQPANIYTVGDLNEWPFEVVDEQEENKEYFRVYSVWDYNKAKDRDGSQWNAISNAENLNTVIGFTNRNGEMFTAPSKLQPQILSDSQVVMMASGMKVVDYGSLHQLDIGHTSEMIAAEIYKGGERESSSAWTLSDQTYVQYVKGGRVIETYKCSLNESYQNPLGELGARAEEFTTISLEDMDGIERGTQKLYIQLGNIDEMTEFVPKKKDFAFRILYGSSFGDSDPVTYRSDFVYMSDLLGIESTEESAAANTGNSADVKVNTFSINDRLYLEVTFHELFLDEIEGIGVAATGKTNMVIDNAAVATYNSMNCVKDSCTGWYNIKFLTNSGAERLKQQAVAQKNNSQVEETVPDVVDPDEPQISTDTTIQIGGQSVQVALEDTSDIMNYCKNAVKTFDVENVSPKASAASDVRTWERVRRVFPVDISFTTAADSKSFANYPVEMLVKYIGTENAGVQVKYYNDIRPYLYSGELAPGATAVLRFLDKDMANIQSIWVRPTDIDVTAKAAEWKIQKLQVSYGFANAELPFSIVPEVDVNMISGEDMGLEIPMYPATLTLVNAENNTGNEPGVDAVITDGKPGFTLEYSLQFSEYFRVTENQTPSFEVMRLDGTNEIAVEAAEVTNQGGGKVAITLPANTSETNKEIYRVYVKCQAPYTNQVKTFLISVAPAEKKPEEPAQEQEQQEQESEASTDDSKEGDTVEQSTEETETLEQ